MENSIEVKLPNVEVTHEEKTEFFKAFLADKPYTAEDKMFDGQFVLKFKSLTMEQVTDVFEQLRKDQNNSLVTTESSYLMTLTNYRIAQSLVSINDIPFSPDTTKDKWKVDADKTYIKATADVFKDWPVFKLSAIAEAFKAFEDKILTLTKEIQTVNFWKAAK